MVTGFYLSGAICIANVRVGGSVADDAGEVKLEVSPGLLRKSDILQKSLLSVS